jgi:hypothetical protein
LTPFGLLCNGKIRIGRSSFPALPTACDPKKKATSLRILTAIYTATVNRLENMPSILKELKSQFVEGMSLFF